METENAVRQWLAGRSANTARAYRRAAMQFAGRLDGDLTAATPGNALDWALALTEAGKAPATVAAMVAAGWSLYEHLRMTGVYGHENPFTPVFVRRPAVRRARTVTPAMVKRLLGAVGGGVLGARDRALVLCLMGQTTTAAVAAYTVADADRREPAVRAAVHEYLRRAGRATAASGEYVFAPLRPRAAVHLHDGDADPDRHLSPAQVAAVVRKLAGRAGVRVGARSLRGAARIVSENG